MNAFLSGLNDERACPVTQHSSDVTGVDVLGNPRTRARRLGRTLGLYLI